MKIKRLDLDRNKKYLLACSFGPDSMALFDMLVSQNYNFVVAHVNYHLREESDFEEAQLKAHCDTKNIPLIIFENKTQITKNVEAKCREIRYEFFKEIYVKEHCDALLVAHHEDDNIETYLLQKKRKNLVKVYGIAENTTINQMHVLRPLLDWSKDALLEYCDDHSVPYSIDKTNLVPMYERNVIRIEVVSKMDAKERCAILKEIAAKNEELNVIFKKIKCVDTNIDEILELNDIEFAYYLNDKIEQINPRFHTTYKQSCEIKKFLTSDKANIELLIFNGMVVVGKEYDKFFVRPSSDFNGYCLMVNEPTLIDNEYFYADLLSDTSNRNIYLTDYPLIIRTYQNNDEYKIKNYSVKVRRLFIDWKMPLYLRKRWPLILNNKGDIIYIPRYQRDFKPDSNCNFYVKECFTLK